MDFVYERCGNCHRKGAYTVADRGVVRCKYCAVSDEGYHHQRSNLVTAAAALQVRDRERSAATASTAPATSPETVNLEGGVLPMDLGTIRALATGAAKARSEESPGPSTPLVSSSATGRQPRAVVIDDDELVRLLITAILERAGIAVTQASSGDEGCAAIIADPPDIALVDLNMPGMDGLEVLVELRGRYNMGLVVVSGRSNEGDRVIALELGADDYVSKPFTPAVLAARVRGVLARYGRLDLEAAH